MVEKEGGSEEKGFSVKDENKVDEYKEHTYEKRWARKMARGVALCYRRVLTEHPHPLFLDSIFLSLMYFPSSEYILTIQTSRASGPPAINEL